MGKLSSLPKDDNRDNYCFCSHLQWQHPTSYTANIVHVPLRHKLRPSVSHLLEAVGVGMHPRPLCHVPRSRCTIRITTSAGVTPDRRAAWPRVRGR